ncbi:hypothetical protein FV225_26200, partial [Methylobacterium sp. WL93]
PPPPPPFFLIHPPPTLITNLLFGARVFFLNETGRAPAARERGTAAFRGRTIDRSHADEAHRIVALADAIAVRRP